MTKILTYTPMVHATVRARQQTGYKYYDLSDDITNFSVSLNTDGCSTFSITLKNNDNKYNGVFTPMDAIVIWLTKSEKYQVFSGYITSCPTFTLYSGPVTITGKDVLYRLQSLYWDSGLLSSRELVTFQSAESTDQDGGYWRAAVNILSAVCGWSADKISIGQLPTEVIQWAMQMYNVRLADTQGADLVNEIYQMLQTSGPNVGNTGQTSGDVFNGDVSEAQKKIIEVAKNSEKYGITAQGGYCQKWVSDVFEKAGVSNARPASAREAARQYGASTDWTKVIPGCCVYGYGWNSGGNPDNVYGHVGIYVGNNTVMDNIGYVKEWALMDWVNAGNKRVPQGTGWGWHGGVIFDQNYPCKPGLLP